MILDLARKLADCDANFFGGWIIAGVEVHIKAPAAQLINKLLLHKSSKAVFEVKGTTAFGTETQKMRVFLVLPQGEVNVQSGEGDFPGRLILEHVFSLEEINAYLAYTGDQNVIHQGSHPLVPGLCVLSYLQEAMGMQQLDWRAAFKSPVYVGEKLTVYAKEGKFTAFVNERLAFVVENR